MWSLLYPGYLFLFRKPNCCGLGRCRQTFEVFDGHFYRDLASGCVAQIRSSAMFFKDSLQVRGPMGEVGFEDLSALD